MGWVSTRFRLAIPAAIREEIVAHATQDRPNECCGMLAGRIVRTEDSIVATVERRDALTNVAAHPQTRYEADPLELLRLQKAWRAVGIDLICIYHSHPASPPIPSRIDRELSYAYGDTVVGMIVSLAENEPTIRVWRYDDDVSEVEWYVV
jgi:proteasome lid subunit RPN8/RPN11